MKKFDKKYFGIQFKDYVLKTYSKDDEKNLFTKNEIATISKRYDTIIRKEAKNKISKRKKLRNKDEKIFKNEEKMIQVRKIHINPKRISIADMNSKSYKLISYFKIFNKYIDVPSVWNSKQKYLIGNKNKVAEKYITSDEIRFNNDKEQSGFAKFKGFKSFFASKKLSLRLFPFGQFYYEGKERESSIHSFVPGFLSESLRNALGISKKALPPWIVNFKRFGRPPSYPTLDITYGLSTDSVIGFGNEILKFYKSDKFSYWV
mmetsp:Transcript_5163/g.8442  ORF Transcript_5163/g.8442 Transcript_5163/m.8442 type:complete len:261 (-) Transcript_5163:3411-4193(-)